MTAGCSEGKSDAERLTDEVGAERCLVPPGGTGGIYTCEFADGRRRCYEVESRPDGEGELQFRTELRHAGACTHEDTP